MDVLGPDAYFDANRKNWDERAPIHARSRMYDVEAFAADPRRLSDVVSFDLPYLDELSGKSAVHLQCHIGTDTLSLARLGATVTGIDQSDVSLTHARELFATTATEGAFVRANVYDAPTALGRRFDLVYTGVGALNWLPDIDRWAGVVAALLQPGGSLYLREGHPVLWALAETTDGSLRFEYPYFETDEPIVWDTNETYTDGDTASVTHTKNYEWNHGLGEIFGALLAHGMVIENFVEHRSCDWRALDHMVVEDGRYVLPSDQRDLMPLMYTLVARA